MVSPNYVSPIHRNQNKADSSTYIELSDRQDNVYAPLSSQYSNQNTEYQKLGQHDINIYSGLRKADHSM